MMADEKKIAEGKEQLLIIVSMLIGLAKSLENRRDLCLSLCLCLCLPLPQPIRGIGKGIG